MQRKHFFKFLHCSKFMIIIENKKNVHFLLLECTTLEQSQNWGICYILPFVKLLAIYIPNSKLMCFQLIPKILVYSDHVFVNFTKEKRAKYHSCLCASLCEGLRCLVSHSAHWWLRQAHLIYDKHTDEKFIRYEWVREMRKKLLSLNLGVGEFSIIISWNAIIF